MKFQPVTNTEHNMYEQAMNLYKISFPLHEQRQAASQANILNDKAYHFNLIYEGDAFAGILLFWETKGFIYVEHFCISPEMRNRCLGGQALHLLAGKGKTIILEIDPPVDEISIRRKDFYVRNGFVENPYSHVHPPYHRENCGHALTVMSCPAGLSRAEYGVFRDYLESHVMANSFI